MNKIIMIITLCLFISICLVACSKSDIIDENPGDTEKSKDTKELTNVSKIINEERFDSGKNTIELKKGLKDETLAIGTHDTYNYENLGINVKEYTLLLLCKDPVYDITYYVNYGDDFYIYRIKDGKSELAVEMPAKRLFCIDGKLYFILESYDLYTFKGIKNGNIFCYDPISGDVSLICDVVAEFMSVYEDGIYFKTNESITKGDDNSELVDQKYFYYSFTTTKFEEINDIFKTLIKWNDYFITLDPDTYETNNSRSVYRIKLETLDKSKSMKLTEKVNFGKYVIYDNKCYYFVDNDFIEHNLETDEEKKIRVPKDATNGDFTIANGMIYFTNLYQYNPETGLLSRISPDNKPYIIYELYSDGINLYGICSLGSKTSGSLKRLEIGDIPNGFINSIESDGVTYEINRLKYQALPIGEE